MNKQDVIYMSMSAVQTRAKHADSKALGTDDI